MKWSILLAVCTISLCVGMGISYSAGMDKETRQEGKAASERGEKPDQKQKKWDKATERRSEEESLTQQIRDADYAGDTETAKQLREQLRQLRQADLRE
ncbi:MAG: hypothetical protein NTZ78_10340 [Candidatus Aureabacteria bacterium]|nr:hypothetical protein [Candidatus Auribacterota bacterium]